MDRTIRDRSRDVRSEVLAGLRGNADSRALTVADLETVIGPAMRAFLAGEVIRPGMVVLHSVTPGPGWLAADGAEVLREGYPDLFRAIGTTFGVGDGSTTFDLPTVADYSGLSAFIKT